MQSHDNSKILREVWTKEKMSIPVIIVPILNRYDLLEQMLDSINYPVDNILIIDNGNNFIYR